MANAVGIVKDISGSFVAKSPDGTIRVLHKGDPVYAKDLVYDTSKNSNNNIVLDLSSTHRSLNISGNKEISLDDAVISGNIDTQDMTLNEADVESGLRDVTTASADIDSLLKQYGDIKSDEVSIDNNEVLLKGHGADVVIANENKLADVVSDLRAVQTHDYTLEQNLDPVGTADSERSSDIIDPATQTATQNAIQPIAQRTTVAPISVTEPTSPTENPIASPVPVYVDNRPRVSVDDVTVDEDAGIMRFTFMADKAADGDIAITYSTNSISATAGDDFTQVSGSVTIPSGEKTIAVEIPIINDNFKEGAENFEIVLSNISDNAKIEDGTGVGTIQDEPSGYTVYAQILVDNNTISEGGELHYIVKLIDENGNDVTLPQGKSVDIALIWSGATSSGEDTSSLPSSVTITGSNQTTFSVSVTDDYISDNNEPLTATISSISNDVYENVIADQNNNAVTTTIQDASNESDSGTAPSDTVYAQISVDKTSATEGDDTLTYTVKLVDKDGNDVTLPDGKSVNVAIAWSGEASGGEDTSSLPSSITITGSNQTTFSVTVTDDYISDNNETLTPTITSITDTDQTFENTAIDPSHNTVTTTITDDTGTPNDISDGAESNHEVVTIKLVALNSDGSAVLDSNGNYTFANDVNEGSDAKYMALAFALGETTFSPDTKLTTQVGTVDINFTNGTATGADYTNTAQNVSLGVVISTATQTDSVDDHGEKFIVNIAENSYSLSNDGYENVNIDTNPVTTTIIESATIRLFACDNSGQPIIDNNDNYTYANEVGEGNAAKYMALAFDPDSGRVLTNQVGTVNISLTNDTATGANNQATHNGSQDYNNTSQTNVALGSVISVDTFDDYLKEGDETFSIKIDSYSDSGASDPYIGHSIDQNNNAVTTTIQDASNESDSGTAPSDTVYAQISVDKTSATEGDDTLTYTVKLVDKDGNDVTLPDGKSVNVAIAWSGEASGGEDTSSLPSSITITGSNQTTFSVTVTDDYISDNNETLTPTITSITDTDQTFENTAIDPSHNTVTTTITDDTGTPNDISDGAESTHEAVILKVVACDENGNPIVDNNNNYTSANDVNEGNSSNYMVLAFKPGETNFNTSTVIASDGTVNIGFTNGTATGATADTTNDGTQDFNNTTKTVNIGQAFSVATFDDYIKDNGETFEVKVINGTYTPSNATTGYENAVADSGTVTTTIKDDAATAQNNTESNHETAKVILVATNVNGDITTNNGVVQIANTNTINEGGKLYYKAVAIDADGKPLPDSGTVDVTFTDSSATSGAGDSSDDYTHTTTNIAIGTVFSADAIDDFTADDNENFTVTISNPTGTDYENVEVNTSHDTVTSTITDDISIGTPVNGDVNEDNFDVTDPSVTISDTKSLGINTSDNSVAYTLAFDQNVLAKDPDTGNTITLTSNGKSISYDYSQADKIVANRDNGDGTSTKVFEITLDKNNAGGSDDKYTYKQYENIDHPDANSDDNITLTFGFNVTNDGTTSATHTFDVVVNDSMPSATSQTIETNEDSSQIIVISQESFDNGTINLNNGVDSASDVANGASIDIYDADKNDKVGTLTNNGNGTLTFQPYANYSGNTAGFTYSNVSDGDGDAASASVAISVTPIGDTPDMNGTNAGLNKTTIKTAQVLEDDNNTQEGTYKTTIGFILPTITDNTDLTGINTDDDQVEKFGLIEIQADDGVILDINGTSHTVTGGKVTIEISDQGAYHYSGIPTADFTLTKAQFEAIQVQLAEDDAVNPKFTISANSYEVNDNDTLKAGPIVANNIQEYEVDVLGVTDDISLIYNQGGTENDSDNTTYTHSAVDEGAVAIDLGAILDATSGDLDGSEIRSYTVSGIPEGTVVNVGGKEAAVAAGQTSVTVEFPDNTVADPSFTMKLPEQYSGTVSATITLTALDTDSDSSGTITPKTASVAFDITVNPVADIVTLQVAQAKGDEDAGRSRGNTSDDINGSAPAIDEPANGIPLDIKVSSEDTDGSETYIVSISDIPDGGSIYVYDKSDNAYHLYDVNSSDANNVTIDTSGNGYKVTISDFDNAHTPKFIPPHNSDADYNLTVSSYSVDSSGNDSSAHTQTLTMNVQVDGVADIPVNDGLATVGVNDNSNNSHNFNATTQEDSTVALKDVLADAPHLNSYDSDGSETLNIKVTNLADGFDITGAGATLIGGSGGSRVWFVDLAHFQNGDVVLTTPTNYAGEIDFEMAMVTTENEGDSKTHAPQDVSVMITPVADSATVNSHDTQNEDQTKELNFSFTSPDIDGANAGHEQLSAFAIKINSIPSGVILKDSNGNQLTDSGDGYAHLTVANGVVETVAATLPEDSNMAGSYDFKYSYSYEDTATDIAGNPYVSQVDVSDQTYTVDVSAVTDDIDMNTTTTTTAGDNSVEADGQTVHVVDNGVFTKTISIAGIDSDGRGNPDYDGSEQFTRITVSGVPEGITVGGNDGVYAGDTGAGNFSGFWYVDIPNEAIDGSTTYDLTFDVNGNLTESNTPYSVTITSYSEDAGNGIEQNDAKSFDLYIDQNIGGTGGTPAVITKFYQDIDQDGTHDHDYTISSVADTNITDSDAYQESVLREDTQFKLSDVVHVETDDTSSSFSITLKNVPDGVAIEGMTYNSQDGGFWTVSGSGNQQAVVDKLQSILITPISNANTDANDITNTDLNFDISLTTYAGENSHNALINFTSSVLPVTDAMDLTTVNDGTTNEDVVQDFSITLDNSADGTHTHIVDGKAYIQLSENYTDTQGTDGDHGVLKLDGNVITTTSVSGVSGITDGDYYVIENVSPDQTLNFSFIPASNRNGTVTVDTYVKNIEQEDWNPFNTTEMTSHSTTSFDVVAVRDGYTFDTTTNPPSGDEDTMVQVSVAVSDPDSSELLTSVSLDKIPNGFLVYYGADEASAVMAQNIGTNGTMTMQMSYGVDETVNYNLWNIPLDNGAMPAYIGIKAPANWSGVIPNVEFHAVDDSGDVSTNPFDITVTPVVDDITISPTQTFGDAGEDIALKLNANAVDLDGSETVTLTLKGLGADASFATDGVHTNAIYDSSTDTYTIENIEAKHINDVTFTQSDMNGSVHVTAQMFEHGVTTGSTIVSGDFDVKVNPVVPTSGDDNLLYSGNDIDALDGTDTIMLKSGGSIDFSNLHNIEKIDLTQNGDHNIGAITLNDVVNVTDENNTLVIDGDSGDSITIDNSLTKSDSESVNGYDVYHSTSGDPTVTLKIEQDIAH